ncbi:MAG: hypothetical protein GX410_07580, partial [Elusimicrobia bacterium]|nr:hypothetical protein [Elusimicrobiota bacterium]
DNVLRMHDSGLYADYADLGNFVMIQAQLSRSEAVRAAAQNLLGTMFSDYVVQIGRENAGPSKATTGVSVYLPAKGSRMLPPSAYSGNPIGASKWGAFIRWLNLDRGDGR